MIFTPERRQLMELKAEYFYSDHLNSFGTNIDQHSTLTPFSLCEDILNKINITENTKVLVICNPEFIMCLDEKLENMSNVSYVTTSEFKYGFATQGAGCNTNVPKYNNYKEFFEDNDLPKFDVVIGNPPYNANLHLKFLEKSYDIANHVVLVHPGSWLYAQKPGNTSALKSKSDKLKLKIGNHFKSFEFINGNRIFNIGLFGPCVITTIDKSKIVTNFQVIDRERKTDEIYTHLNFNPLFDNTGIFDSIKNKIWKYCEIDNIQKNTNKTLKYFLPVPIISGHISNNVGKYKADDFYQLMYNKDKMIHTTLKIRGSGEKSLALSFNTSVECKNCLNYIDSNIAKFSLMIIKVNQHLDTGELKYVPFFDFTEEWPDEKIYKELNLTQEEIQYIEDHI